LLQALAKVPPTTPSRQTGSWTCSVSGVTLAGKRLAEAIEEAINRSRGAVPTAG
jgi:hypothetical protein